MFHPHHPGEDRLLWALRRSPLDPRVWLVRLHLLRCRLCRLRVASSEARLFRQFAPLETTFDALLPTAEESRRRLLNKIRATHAGPSSGAQSPQRGVSRVHLVGGALVAALAGLVFFTRVPAHHAPLAADDVLARAAEMEVGTPPDAAPGVVFRRVQVTAGGERVAWPVYRDTQGHRVPRFKVASASESALLARLSAAGVTRADPLSAAAYRDWRDRLKSHAESTVRSSRGRITITTSLPLSEAGAVQSESLTLRDNDYHAISRTVEFRDAGTVEIAELEYQVLPWSQAGRDWFVSDAAPALPMHPAIAAAPSAPIPQPPLSETQLDLAELDARLVLSRERADVTDQLAVVRNPRGVLIQGLVGTPERKQHLNAALASVANARTQLSTPDEFAAQERDAAGPPVTPAPVKLIESVSTASPLLIDWTRQQRDPARLPETASALLESTLRMAQQGRALREVVHEFAAKPPLDGPADEAYKALLQDHAGRLRAALAEQSSLVAALTQGSPSSAEEPAPAAVSGSLLEDVDALDRAASRSMALCRELTAGQRAGEQAGQREAQPILRDLALESLAVTAELDRLRRLEGFSE